MLVRHTSDARPAVIRTLDALQEVTYVSSLIGRADTYAQVICADNAALWSVVRQIDAIPGVEETETMLEMQIHKFVYRDIASLSARGAT